MAFSSYLYFLSTLIVTLQWPLSFSILRVTPVSVRVHQHTASTHLYNPLLNTRMISPHLTWLSRFVWREMSPSSISLAEPHSPKTWHSLHRWKQLRLVVPRAFRRPPLRRPMSTRSNVHPRWVPAKPMLHPRNSLWKLVGDWCGYHQRGGEGEGADEMTQRILRTRLKRRKSAFHKCCL